MPQDTHRGLPALVMILLITGVISVTLAPIKIPWEGNSAPISGWNKKVGLAENFPVQMATADHKETAIYQNADGFEIYFSAAYFERQSPGKELIEITTARLHEDAEEMMIPIAGRSSMRVNKGIYQRNEQTHLVVFWYEMDGQVVSRWTDIKRLTLLNALTKRKTNGTLVVVSSPLGKREQATELLEKQLEFIRHFVSA